MGILLVLIALAFAAIITALTQGAFFRVEKMRGECASVRQVEIEVDTAITARQEPPPPMTNATWSGTCLAGEHGWPDMPIAFDLEFAPGDQVHATGTLEFVGRRTRAELHGALWSDRINLRG